MPDKDKIIEHLLKINPQLCPAKFRKFYNVSGYYDITWNVNEIEKASLKEVSLCFAMINKLYGKKENS